MPAGLATAELTLPNDRARRPLGFELAFVVIVALAVNVPGIWSYSLVDPWETHYGEVGRMMLQNNDWVHTDWPQDNEGFRSKPVLSFWMIAGGMRAVGMAENGGYSGEMVHDGRTMIAIRLPFILAATTGLAFLWWMLARLLSRRVAWLALLVVGTSPMFSLISRQGLPDVPLSACILGALSLFVMAVEDGERPILPRGELRLGRRVWSWNARHVVLGLIGAAILLQAAYYCIYFAMRPPLAIRVAVDPALWLPGMMVVMFAALHRDGWLIVRLPFLVIGGLVAAIVNAPLAPRPPTKSVWRHIIDDVLRTWDRYALDRYVVRFCVFALVPLCVHSAASIVALALRRPDQLLVAQLFAAWIWPLWIAISLRWRGSWPLANWADAGAITERLLAMAKITTMRQLYLLGCYSLLGISVLAKGPPGLAVVGLVGVLHVVMRFRWRALYDGAFELKRGLLIIIATFLPWHIGMFLRHGPRFVDEYLYFHILNRASVGVDNSFDTFEYYTSQLGHGMWLWAGLVPAAITALVLRTRNDSREDRVRFTIALWAIGTVAFFSLVTTKFHHYILPAVPALGVVVALFLDDLLAGRARLHPLFALVGIAIALLVCRDLMFEPERWIEMFVYRSDRPWPAGEPWQIDLSDGFLGLGIAGAIAIAITATPWRQLGVAALGGTALAICLWSSHAYMPHAGTHWGMRDGIRAYYDQRTIYGQKLVYFGTGQLYDDWADAGERWSFDSHIPTDLQIDQPMTITVQVNKANDERIMEQQIALVGRATKITDHTIEVTFAPGERQKLAALIEAGKTGPRGRRLPVRVVDADRLLAWQLYWRGENFWSGEEIWGFLPEMRTAFVKTDNIELNKYINDRSRAPLGRRYFVVTEASRITGIRASLPTQRARDTYEVLDTSSNKFSLAAFWL